MVNNQSFDQPSTETHMKLDKQINQFLEEKSSLYFN
jgi:hypothetical protein